MLMLILIVELDPLPHPQHLCLTESDCDAYPGSNLTNTIPCRIMINLTGAAFSQFQLETTFLDRICFKYDKQGYDITTSRFLLKKFQSV